MKTGKICSHCRKDLSTLKFGKNAAMKDGLNKECKNCVAQTGRKIRLADRLDVLRHYSIGNEPSCECCGETKWEFLSMDHLRGGGKAHIESIGYNLTRWLKRHGYPSGYRVLCHNCNFAIGHYGFCPHKKPSTRYAEAIEHSRKRGGDRKSKKAIAMMIADNVRNKEEK